jgi:hypothetical protein
MECGSGRCDIASDRVNSRPFFSAGRRADGPGLVPDASDRSLGFPPSPADLLKMDFQAHLQGPRQRQNSWTATLRRSHLSDGGSAVPVCQLKLPLNRISHSVILVSAVKGLVAPGASVSAEKCRSLGRFRRLCLRRQKSRSRRGTSKIDMSEPSAKFFRERSEPGDKAARAALSDSVRPSRWPHGPSQSKR